MCTFLNCFKSSHPVAFEYLLFLACVMLATAIFVTDIQIPLGVASGVPYILLILLALWSSSAGFAVYIGSLCTALILLGYYYSPEGSELWHAVSNRGLALFAIWVTVLLTILWKACEKKIFSLQNQLGKEKIYRSTIHGSQHIINNLLNQLLLIEYKARSGEIFDAGTLEKFDAIMYEAKTLMECLSNVDPVEEDRIKQSVYTCRELLYSDESVAQAT